MKRHLFLLVLSLITLVALFRDQQRLARAGALIERQAQTIKDQSELIERFKLIEALRGAK
jgi:hypothetical protein